MSLRTFVLVVGAIVTVLGASARGEFIPGHVFVAQSPGENCNDPAKFGSDLIWEINPQTGQATLFLEIPDELCGFITGLAFTPDGSRLRASMWRRGEIWEFDSDGNFAVVLDSNDGIACPWGFNNLAYDAEGNFYVARQCPDGILRFPVDGGPATIFADADDGIDKIDAIAFAADGDLYLARHFPFAELWRITPDGSASLFDSYSSTVHAETVVGDKSGHVYVGVSGDVFRYNAGDPDSKELFAVLPLGKRHSMAMSPDQSMIYVNVFASTTTGKLLGVDVVDGTVTTLAEFQDEGAFVSIPAGIAVVPPAPIPTLSAWSLAVMVLLVLTGGTIVIQRGRPVIG